MLIISCIILLGERLQFGKEYILYGIFEKSLYCDVALAIINEIVSVLLLFCHQVDASLYVGTAQQSSLIPVLRQWTIVATARYQRSVSQNLVDQSTVCQQLGLAF